MHPTFIHLEAAIAAVIATTLPGLHAHLAEFRKFLRNNFDCGKVGAKRIGAIIKGIEDGMAPATLPAVQAHFEELGELVEGFGRDDDGTCEDWYNSIVEGFETLIESRLAA